MTEPRVIYLGTIADAEGVGLFDVPLNGSVEEIRAAIAAAEAVKREAAARESERLRKMFLPEPKADDDAPPQKPPVYRDWLLP